MAPALLLVALYLGSSALGAFAFGSFVSSAELSVRVLAVGLVALVLIELVGPMTVISTLSRVLAAAAIFVSATGTRRLRSTPDGSSEVSRLSIPMKSHFWPRCRWSTSSGAWPMWPLVMCTFWL